MPHPPPSVTVLGEGPLSDHWRFAAAAVAKLAPEAGARPDALVVVSSGAEAGARAKAALEAGVAVLHAAPGLLSPQQTASLLSAAQRGGASLRFAEPFQHHPGFAFLHRLLTGDEPLWPLRYLRSTNLAPGDRLDELAAEELVACDALVDRPALRVNAAASPAGDERARALFLTIEYAGGILVRTAVSTAEPVAERRLVAVTAHRSFLLDWHDARAPLQSIGAEGGIPHAPSNPVERADPLTAELSSFLDAVRAHDRTLDNGARRARVTAIWQAARHSISFGETMALPIASTQPATAGPPRLHTKPPLRVIRGGGRVAPAGRRRPALTVIAS